MLFSYFFFTFAHNFSDLTLLLLFSTRFSSSVSPCKPSCTCSNLHFIYSPKFIYPFVFNISPLGSFRLFTLYFAFILKFRFFFIDYALLLYQGNIRKNCDMNTVVVTTGFKNNKKVTTCLNKITMTRNKKWSKETAFDLLIFFSAVARKPSNYPDWSKRWFFSLMVCLRNNVILNLEAKIFKKNRVRNTFDCSNVIPNLCPWLSKFLTMKWSF